MSQMFNRQVVIHSTGFIMDNKIIAIVVVGLILLCGGIFFALNNGGEKGTVFDEKAVNTIGRMCDDGSGIYIKADILDPDAEIPTNAYTDTPFFTKEGNSYKVTEANKKAWGGLVLGDPELHSIQHAQIAGIAKSAGLGFQEYTDGTTISDDKLYYSTNLYNFDLIDDNGFIDGGIIWEPVYQKVATDSTLGRFAELTPTKRMTDLHTCSIIGANHDWLMQHGDDAVRFLAAYIESTDSLNKVLTDKGEQYEKLIDDLSKMAEGFTEEELKACLENVTYVYADDSKGSLDDLEEDIVWFCGYLKETGLIKSEKFKDSEAFSDAFVDDSYMKKAAKGDAPTEGKVTLRLPDLRTNPVLLPLLFGDMTGVFEKHGITIEWVEGKITAGDDVVKMLMEKKIDIGFFGVPPALEEMINGEHILV